jgi:hypothetical protein
MQPHATVDETRGKRLRQMLTAMCEGWEGALETFWGRVH